MPTVCLFLENDDNISGSDSWGLVTLSRKGDLLAVPHTLVHMHLQNLALALRLLSLALLATILLLDDFSLSVAFLTNLLDLLHHSGSNLPQANCGTLSIASLAGL